MREELKLVKHQVKQLADLVVRQQEVTRQLFSQLLKSQEKEEVHQNPSQPPSQMIQLVEEDQSRLKGQEKWSNKAIKHSHQWSSRTRSEECELPKKSDQEKSKRDRKFTPLNKSKEEMLHLLISRGKITELLPPLNPETKRYDPTKFCLYHSNSPGHATEECWALKHKIQNLIENGELNVTGNHETPTIKEGKEKMKRIPPKTNSSKGMAATTGKIDGTRSRSVIIQGVAKETGRDCPTMIPSSEPFIPTAMDLKVGPPKNLKLMPLVNWSNLDAHKWCVEPSSDRIPVTIENIPNAEVASIAAIKDNMTVDN